MGFGVQEYVLLSVVCAVARAVEEPQCSRYHYEAQTLERVIKTEIKLDALGNEIQQIKQEMTKEMVKDNEQNMQMKEQLERIQKDFENFSKNNSLREKAEKTSMRQFCTSDAMCSDVEEAECKRMMCKCKPGLSYHHGSRKCLSDCGEDGYGRTFQVETDTYLSGFNTKTLRSISVEDCVNECLTLQRTEFTCRTVEYWKANEICYLSWETLYTNPDVRYNNTNYDLYIRDCRTD